MIRVQEIRHLGNRPYATSMGKGRGIQDSASRQLWGVSCFFEPLSRSNLTGQHRYARRSLLASTPPNHPIGRYATTKSSAINQVGAGIMVAAMMPAIKNNAPIPSASFICRLAASSATTMAPANVPSACARKGNKKCLGSNRWMLAARLSA